MCAAVELITFKCEIGQQCQPFQGFTANIDA